jgi:acetyl esterase
MPVDPPIAGLLAMIEQTDPKPLADVPLADARDAFLLMTVGMRDPATLAPVRSTEDGEVAGPAGPVPIRTYRPDVEGTVPTVVFFHGGGFVIGDIETHDDHARLISHQLGAVVVSVDYRLAPEHKFPAAFEDCMAATRWAADHIDSLGGDAAKLGVAGDSAGGNLAGAVALASRENGPRIAAQLLIYPAVDFDADAPYPSRVDNAEGYLLTAADSYWFRDQYLPADYRHDDPRGSLLRGADFTGTPPAVIGIGEFDPLRDEGEAYAKALSDAGVEVVLHRFDGLIHGFYGLGPLSPASAAAIRTLNDSFRDLLA